MSKKDWRQLQAYKATGLTPEQIEELKKKKSADPETTVYDCTDRAVELADADKDGRVVILPLKVGDTVYCLQDYFNDATLRREKRVNRRTVDFIPSLPDLFETDGLIYKFRDIGKTVFLTYEAAVAALKGVEKNA